MITESDSEYPTSDVLARAGGSEYRIDGPVGAYIENLIAQWLLRAPDANPAMLEMMRDRDHAPLREMVPWAGEFAGKYLTGAVEVMRLSGDDRLRWYLDIFVRRLLSLQADDGYLGPWPKAHRLTNRRPVPRIRDERREATDWSWDTWGHYHVMMGLMHWHEATGSKAAMDAAARIADLLCSKYLGRRKVRLVDTGSPEMNLAPTHGLARLYRKKNTDSYIRLARQVIDEFQEKSPMGLIAGNYLRGPLEGKEFHDLPLPRWESLHPIMGMIETWRVTGEADLRTAFERIWWSIVRHDRHNNGGFTSGERATGNPYDRDAIETCCTIAWSAMSVEMLKLTGNSIVADELELTFLNSVLGMHGPLGRCCTYNTPMDGVRRSSAHDIVFQSREGSPELNCCSVNSARGFGLISEWGLMSSGAGDLTLNWYGPGEVRAEARKGLHVSLTQVTSYPAGKGVRITVRPQRVARLNLRLRIPRWSRRTRVEVNDENVDDVQPGQYLSLERTWRKGDTIHINFDFAPHYWVGENQCRGRLSVYRGPLLLAFDQRYNLGLLPNRNDVQRQANWRAEVENRADIRKLLDMPVLNPVGLKLRKAAWKEWAEPMLLVKCDTVGGGELHLCDFASAGDTGSPYLSWLPYAHQEEIELPSYIHPCPDP